MSDSKLLTALTERLPLGGLWIAAIAGVTAVAGSYAVAGFSPSFVVVPIDALVIRLTPGALVTLMIENVGNEAHALHVALSVAIAAGLFAAAALGGLRLGAAAEDALGIDRRAVAGLGAGIGAWAITTAIVREPVTALGAGGPAALFTALGAVDADVDVEFEPSRRRTLSALGFVGAAGAVGALFGPSQSVDALDAAPGTDGVSARLDEASELSLDVAGSGLAGYVSDIENFYNVDIASVEPELSAEDWSMTITGELAEEDLTVGYDDLTELPVENRFVTLRCVGEGINGKKLDTALWTGTPIAPLLDEVDPNGDCGCVMVRGEDDYFVQYPAEVLREGFLAWGMNGRELPPSHGHPVRILIPGHWGETNVKWLSEIEVLDEEAPGYWEQRGWQGTGAVNTVAKLWDEGITELDDGRVELAGHAYAGVRGVDAVEVSTDGGESWTEAELADPLPGDDVWRQYRHVFDPDGSHEVVVRAVDGEGTRQTSEETDSAPSGATGWVQRTVEG